MKTKSILRLGIVLSLLSLFLWGNLLPVQAESSLIAAQSWDWKNPLNVQDTTLSASSSSSYPITSSSSYNPTASSIQELETLIQNALERRQSSINILYTGSSSDLQQQKQIFNSLLSADDYLHYNITSSNYGYRGYEGQANVYFNIGYLTTLQQENYINEQVAVILSTIISSDMNEHEKEKAIHDYIVRNVAYDTDYSPSSHSAYTALYEQKAVCQGYALLTYKMLSAAGLSVRCIIGTGGSIAQDENHLWNLVCLDGNWYHLDCTWDDPVPDKPGQAVYNYYNLSDQEIALDHSWKNEDYPPCNKSYYQELNNKLSSDPDNRARWQSLLMETDLYLLSPENTAATPAALEEKIHNSLLRYETSLKLRFKSSEADPSSLLKSVFNSALIATACPNCYIKYSYSPYNRGGEDGYYLLTATFSYHNNIGNANLSQLSLSSGQLCPAFDPAISSYSVNVDNSVSSMIFTPTAASAAASIKLNGNTVSSASPSPAIVLNPGVNNIYILVTAQNGSDRTYTISINREFPSPAIAWTPWKEEKTISPEHPCWTITFSRAVDANSINSQNIFIANNPEGSDLLSGIAAPRLVSTNEVLLYPPSGEGWSPGTYYLFISPDVKSANSDKTLEKGLRMKFRVQ